MDEGGRARRRACLTVRLIESEGRDFYRQDVPRSPTEPTDGDARPEPALDPLLQHLRRLSVDERLALNDAAMRAAIELRAAFARIKSATE